MNGVLSIWRRWPHTAALLLIVAATAARCLFVVSGQLDLVQDEAQYWDWSRRLQFSYYSKGPLIAWIIKAFTAIFGDTELGVRAGAVAGSLAAQLALYWGVAHLMRKPRLAVIALFILNTLPMFLASGILMTTDNPLLVCWIASLFCLHAACVRPQARWPWIGLCCTMALGVLAKYTMLGMIGVAVMHAAFLAWHGTLPKGHCKKLFVALGVGACIGLAPIVLWNAQNDWASFRHVGRLAGVAPAAGESPPLIRFDRFPEHIGGQLGMVYPWWFVFMAYGGVVAAKMCFVRPAPDASRDEKEDKAAAALFVVGFWPIFLFFLLWSFHTRIYANWPAMCYAAGVALAALGVDRVLEKHRFAVESRRAGADAPPVPRTRRLFPVWAGLSVALCLVMYAQEPVSRLLPDSANPAARLKGWSDLGRRVDEIRKTMPDPEKVFIFSDAYDVAAELAFYVPGKPVVYCSDFGRRLNQYDFWPGPEDKKGWSAVFVRRKPFASPPRELKSMFVRLGAPEAYHSVHRGGKGRSFGVLAVQDFTGEWPRKSKGIY